MTSRVETLIRIARELAEADAHFQAVKGPGAGDRATAAFLATVQRRAHDEFGIECWEKKICGETSYAVDFYFPDEAAIVEVALGLPNPSSEFEKDIFKAVIAQDYWPVRRLVFISRAGGEKKCEQPGRQALRNWAAQKHQLSVEVYDLPGIPRVRRRSRKKRPEMA